MPQCPACKIECDAIYLGAIHVECINPHCRHYSDKARKIYNASLEHPSKKPVEPEQKDLFDDDEVTAPGWPSYFGHD